MKKQLNLPKIELAMEQLGINKANIAKKLGVRRTCAIVSRHDFFEGQRSFYLNLLDIAGVSDYNADFIGGLRNFVKLSKGAIGSSSLSLTPFAFLDTKSHRASSNILHLPRIDFKSRRATPCK